MYVQIDVKRGREEGLSYRLEPECRCLIGRADSADLQLTDTNLSRRHLVISLDATGASVTDLGSRNGTRVQGQRINPHEPYRLQHRNSIQAGEYVLRLTIVSTESQRTSSDKWRLQDAASVPPGYELESLLGEGSYSRVWAIRARQDGARYALKLLRQGADPEDLERFLREGQVCTTLQSSFLVRTFAYGVSNERPYILMERVQGVSADQLLKKSSLPLRVALQLAEDTARGLDVAHRHGIIHRDVKPGNILVTARQRAKLTDFGIAKIAEFDPLTGTGLGLGSLHYVAPEQSFQARDASASSDLYSLGATLYHFLAGRTPFELSRRADMDAMREALHKIENEAPAPLTTFNPTCPPEVEALVSKLLSKSPLDRGDSAEEVAVALRCMREQVIAARGGHAAAAETQRGMPAVKPPPGFRA